ncbi:MAG: nitroreductase family protein [Anaerohalosphaeraceae bacterium]|nr:nitroreductase family protein [Anaerohalosphaeraceae bacterium]
MDIYEAIRHRYSCRAYANTPIEKEKLDRILTSAAAAPSAKNLRDWRFVVVTDTKIKEQLKVAANNQSFIAQAPVVIVGCSNSDYVMRCGHGISLIDLSIAMEHIALTATAEGLATCWIGSFYPEKVRAVLGIPETIEVVELMTIGTPTDEEKHKALEPLENVVCYDKWKF